MIPKREDQKNRMLNSSTPHPLLKDGPTTTALDR